MHAIHLNYHDITEDPRVLKECYALAERGVDVTVVCALKQGRAAREQVGPLTVCRIPWLSFEDLTPQYLAELSDFPNAARLVQDRLQPLTESVKTIQSILNVLRADGELLDPETAYRPYSGLKRAFAKIAFKLKFASKMRHVKRELGADTLRQGLQSSATLKTIVANPKEALIAREKEVYQASAFLFDLNAQALGFDKPVDIIHAHDIYTLVAGMRLSKALDAKLVYDAHEYEPGRVSKMPPEGNDLVTRIEVDCLAHADALITVSPGIQDLYRDRFSNLPQTLVMNAPDISGPLPDKTILENQRDAFRKKLGVASDTPLLVFTGLVLGRQRGLPQVAEALCLLPQFHLVILGPRDARHDGKLMKVAKKCKVADRVHMLPSVPHAEVVATIRACDVCVIPIQDAGLSYRFTMPNKLFEGVFAGLPVAVSDLPDMKAFVEKLGVGAVMDEGSPESIAQTVETLYREREGYVFTPERFESLVSSYSWSTQATRLHKLYQSLTAKPE